MACHHYETYRIILDAAWKHKNDVSVDEANLLRVLREHLHLSQEDHWMISVLLKRFPKQDCQLHTRDEIHDARKALQRDTLLWSYRNEQGETIDIIPTELVSVLRQHVVSMELQRINYERMLQHNEITLPDLKQILKAHFMILLKTAGIIL